MGWGGILPPTLILLIKKAVYLMTNEELAIKIKQGSIDLLPQLWEQIKLFIYRYSYRYFTLYGDSCTKAGADVDDLMQEGYFALLDAVQAYKPESEYKFLTFIGYPLKNHFNALVGFRGASGRNSLLNNSMSLDKPLDGTQDILLGHSVPDAKAECEMDSVVAADYQDRLCNDLQGCIDDLPPDQQEIIKKKYYHGSALTEVALQTRKNYSMVKTLEQKALYKLRRDKRLRVYKEEMMVKAYRSSFSSWVNTRTSSTERTAMMLCDFDNYARWEKKAIY